jgi:uncharacterized protein
MTHSSALLLLLTAAASLQAQMLPRPATSEAPFLTVQGRGEVRVPNTVAVIHLGFEAAGPGEAAVREEVTRRSQSVLTTLKSEEKVQRLETTAVNIRPQFSPIQPEAGKHSQPPKITGYLGQVVVSFESPVEEAGRMTTRPADASSRAAENEALTLAAQDAEAQARTLLEALKLKWAGIRSVDATGGRFDPRPMPRAAMMMAADAAPLPELDIEGGETVLTREVTLQVEFSVP